MIDEWMFMPGEFIALRVDDEWREYRIKSVLNEDGKITLTLFANDDFSVIDVAKYLERDAIKLLSYD